MDRIREKPSVSNTIREKAKAAPKELVHRGLDGGAERLRTQLRDTAQQGRQDGYGGDRIEDTAADGMRRMERGAEKLIKERKKNRADAGRDSGGSTLIYDDTGSAAHAGECEAVPPERGKPAGPGRLGAEARIKTKDAYMRAQEETPATALPPEQAQGGQQFIRERGRKAAQETAIRKAGRGRLAAGDPAAPAGTAVGNRHGEKARAGRAGHDGAMPVRPAQSRPDAAALPKGKTAGSAPAVKAAGQPAAILRAKSTVHAPRQVIRTADRAGHAGIQTARAGAQTGRAAARAARSAKSMRAAQQAAQYRRRAKAVGSAAKKAAANAGKALRAILAAARSLMAAAAAGGAVVLSLLIVICLVGLLIASPFGILFTSEPVDGTAVALSTAIAQINVEYTQKLDELQAGEYDQIIIDSAPPDWREVVAVFAVRTAGVNDGVDVVTLDADRVDRLRAVFWDMVSLSSEVETIEHGDSDPDDDVDDNWTETILTITVTDKSLDEMRDFYSFTDEQNNMLDELLDHLDLIGGAIGNLAVTEANAKELLAALPDNLSAERREVIETACQLVGKVNYFWGGKSLVLGWDSCWGTTMQVTAAGSSSTGTYRPFGMDCSGYVDWVFYNASGGEYIIGHGGGAASQHGYCAAISWDEAMPGDLVFYPEDSHVGIVGGRDESGNLLIIHCASGYNNVVITGIEGFASIGRPVYFPAESHENKNT